MHAIAIETVVDPGFPRRGAPTSKAGCHHIIWPNFYQKLDENERIGPGGGGGGPSRHPLDPPMIERYVLFKIRTNAILHSK